MGTPCIPFLVLCAEREGQINASSSPYEGEDDFFARDDLALTPARTATPTSRMRGHSESAKA